MASSTYKAVVFGSTGATGREIVKELAASAMCERVIAITRREVAATDWVRGEGKDAEAAKIQVQVVNFDNLASSLKPSEESGDCWRLAEQLAGGECAKVCFYTLGSTRREAGSAEEFKRIDLGYLEGATKICKEAGVSHFSLVSSVGASASSFFLYPQVKGMGEEAVKVAGFDRVSVWRPGLLGRGDKARLVERIAGYISPKTPTSTLARAMVRDAEQKLSAGKTEPATLYVKDIFALAG